MNFRPSMERQFFACASGAQSLSSTCRLLWVAGCVRARSVPSHIRAPHEFTLVSILFWAELDSRIRPSWFWTVKNKPDPWKKFVVSRLCRDAKWHDNIAENNTTMVLRDFSQRINDNFGNPGGFSKIICTWCCGWVALALGPSWVFVEPRHFIPLLLGRNVFCSQTSSEV